MSCARIDEQLRAGLTDEHRNGLLEHAKTCTACHERLQLGAAARATLIAAAPPPSFGAAQRWRSAMVEPSPRRSFLWPAVVAAGAIVALLILRTPEVDAPTPVLVLQKGAVHQLDGQPLAAIVNDEWMRFEPNSVIHVRGAKFETKSRLAMLVPSVELRPIRVAYGAAKITLEKTSPRPFLATPVSTIVFESGEFDATITDRRTIVEPRVGAVQIQDHDGTVRRVVAKRATPPPDAVAKAPPPKAREPKRSRAVENRRVLERARSLVGQDDVRASELAEKVLSRRPSMRTEAEALMIAADAWRRRGGRTEAERYYRRATEHPGGDAFLEEASFRRASLLAQLGRTEDAIDVLRRAEVGRYGAALVPERSALYARLLLERSRIDEATAVLEAVAARTDRILDPPRVDVADALRGRAPKRAAELIRGVAGRPGPAREAAQRLLEKIERK